MRIKVSKVKERVKVKGVKVRKGLKYKGLM